MTPLVLGKKKEDSSGEFVDRRNAPSRLQWASVFLRRLGSCAELENGAEEQTTTYCTVHGLTLRNNPLEISGLDEHQYRSK